MREQKTENFLKKHNYAFTFREKMPIALIDFEEARSNPGRLAERLDKNRVSEMKDDMLDGDDFPAIVVLDRGAGEKPMLLLTGSHRLDAALAAGLDVFDAYLVAEPDEMSWNLLLRMLNEIEGKSPDRDERMQLAKSYLEQFPKAPIPTVAKAMHFSAAALHNYLKEMKLEDRARELEIADILAKSSVFSQKVKLELNKIKNDTILDRTVHAIEDTNVKAGRAHELIKSIVAAKSDRKRHEVIEEFIKDVQEERQEVLILGRRRMDIPTKAMKPVRQLAKQYREYGSPAKLKFDAIPYTQLVSDLENVCISARWLEKMKQELERLIGVHEKAKSWKAA